MCGICGVIALSPGRGEAPHRDRAATMLGTLLHRGPHESRLASDRAGTIGATRLAIRGIESGSQPIVDDATGVVVACNGEIDNHRELRAWLEGRGHRITLATDIAVIPALYLEHGDQFPEHLVGAFAVAVWDPRGPSVLLARDRAGEKPLFYAFARGEVLFASEVASLLVDARVPRDLDVPALRHYLRFGCFEAPTAPVSAVRRVGPGEIVSIRPSGVARRRYWRLRFEESGAPPSPDAFDPVFRGAVMRVSDAEVPRGVFLSGGLDSALVATVARRSRPDVPLRAYTARFAEVSYDEGDHAAGMAKHLALDWTPVDVSASAVPGEIEGLVATSGEPLGDPAWVPMSLLARRAVEDVRLVLVGEGADELFGGYPTYIGALAAETYARWPRAVRAIVSRAVGAWPVSDKKVTVSYLLKRFVEAGTVPGLARHRLWTSQVPPRLLAQLGLPPGDLADTSAPGRPLLDVLQENDFETSLAEGLLTKADRATMGNAVELRAPYLDAGVLAFAAKLPGPARARGLTTKIFLKRYAERYLPHDVIYRTKRGLSVPLATWLRGPLKDWALARVSSGRLADVGIDVKGARALLDDHLSRRADLARPLWTILVLSVWLDWHAGVGVGARRVEAPPRVVS